MVMGLIMLMRIVHHLAVKVLLLLWMIRMIRVIRMNWPIQSIRSIRRMLLMTTMMRMIRLIIRQEHIRHNGIGVNNHFPIRRIMRPHRIIIIILLIRCQSIYPLHKRSILDITSRILGTIMIKRRPYQVVPSLMPEWTAIRVVYLVEIGALLEGVGLGRVIESLEGLVLAIGVG